MSLNSKNINPTSQINERALLERKFEGARTNMLIVVVMTLVNIVLLVLNTNTYFLFSAYIPYLLADFGMLFCGMYPAEIYTEELAGMEILPKSFLVIVLAIAAVIVALYFLSWIFSKKQKKGWLIFALIFFSIDTLAMFVLNGFYVEAIIDYAIHVWVIVSLISGISALSKLKKLPSEEDAIVEAVEVATEKIADEAAEELPASEVVSETEETPVLETEESTEKTEVQF